MEKMYLCGKKYIIGDEKNNINIPTFSIDGVTKGTEYLCEWVLYGPF